MTIIAADLDGTLALSKSSIDEEMAALISEILQKTKFVIISGGEINQFLTQVVNKLDPNSKFSNLILFPTCGTSCWVFKEDEWKREYHEEFSAYQKNRIIETLMPYVLPNSYGDVIEDRGGQITFSALGQKAPLEVKQGWDPSRTKRKDIISKIQTTLSEFEIRIGGTTSIDITRKGIDKAYAIKKMEEKFGIKKENILFFGDALEPGGNDYAVEQCGVRCMAVSGPEETKKILEKVIIKYEKKDIPLPSIPEAQAA